VAGARRKRAKQRPRKRVETASYEDREGNVLELRKALSEATIAKVNEAPGSAAASIEDAWQRREEMLFERLATRWEIAGLPLTEQKLLLGRYRMADPEQRRWVRATINQHIETWIPGLEPAAGGP
jgi:hypothetical protein